METATKLSRPRLIRPKECTSADVYFRRPQKFIGLNWTKSDQIRVKKIKNPFHHPEAESKGGEFGTWNLSRTHHSSLITRHFPPFQPIPAPSGVCRPAICIHSRNSCKNLPAGPPTRNSKPKTRNLSSQCTIPCVKCKQTGLNPRRHLIQSKPNNE